MRKKKLLQNLQKVIDKYENALPAFMELAKDPLTDAIDRIAACAGKAAYDIIIKDLKKVKEGKDI